MQNHPYLDRPLRSELDAAREKLEDAIHNALHNHRLMPDYHTNSVIESDRTAIAHWQRRVAALEGRA